MKVKLNGCRGTNGQWYVIGYSDEKGESPNVATDLGVFADGWVLPEGQEFDPAKHERHFTVEVDLPSFESLAGPTVPGSVVQ